MIPSLDLTPVIKGLFYMCLCTIPLAAWKLVDIIIWVTRHTSVSFN